MAHRSTLRASDADRDQIADRLRHAASEGRLTTDELEQRLTTAFSARTHGELGATVADLPSAHPGRSRSRSRRALDTARAHPVAVAAAIPLALVAVAVMLAIAIAWSTVWLIALLLLGRHRRARAYLYWGPRRIVRGPAPWL